MHDTNTFNRAWNQYSKGFGAVSGNYWAGLEEMHRWTTPCPANLLINVRPFGQADFITYKYRQFSVASEEEDYKISLSMFDEGNGNDDIFSSIDGNSFSATNVDNDSDDQVTHVKVTRCTIKNVLTVNMLFS